MKPPGKPASPLRNIAVHSLLIGAVAASVGGVVFFFVLFLPDFNIYWWIFAPIILAFYQAPAAFLFWLWKKKRPRTLTTDESEPPPSSPPD